MNTYLANRSNSKSEYLVIANCLVDAFMPLDRRLNEEMKRVAMVLRDYISSTCINCFLQQLLQSKEVFRFLRVFHHFRSPQIFFSVRNLLQTLPGENSIPGQRGDVPAGGEAM